MKNSIRQFVQIFGYDITKHSNFEYGKNFKRKSPDSRYDYYETPIGNYFFPKNSKADLVANSIKKGEIFDRAILDAAKPFIKPGTAILDIGANYGQMSIEFSKIAKDVVVYSFDAQKMVFEILEKNIECNNVKNVKLFYNAVYDIDNVEFVFPEPDLVRFSSYGSYGIDLNAKKGIPVKSLTIDSLNIDTPISFMKIDIQGSDLAAMRGAVNTIAKNKMPIVFEYEEQFQEEFNTSFQDYVDFVNSIGYKFLKTIQEINFLIVPK